LLLWFLLLRALLLRGPVAALLATTLPLRWLVLATITGISAIIITATAVISAPLLWRPLLATTTLLIATLLLVVAATTWLIPAPLLLVVTTTIPTAIITTTTLLIPTSTMVSFFIFTTLAAAFKTTQAYLSHNIYKLRLYFLSCFKAYHFNSLQFIYFFATCIETFDLYNALNG
jgi:hypothetical protein